MEKSGGIIAIIAGILGLFAAVVTLMAGGVGAVFNADKASTVIGLGWGGIFFCFLTIIFGAVAINAKSRTPGILIIISSILGATLGGNLVAILMVLALVGGVLATVGAPVIASNVRSDFPLAYSKGDDFIVVVIVAVLLIAGVVYFVKDKHQADSSSERIAPKNEETSINAVPTEVAQNDPLEKLAEAQSSDLEPNGRLAEKFSLGGDSTDLQRQLETKEIVGKIVTWRLPVYEVKQSGDEYIIQTANTFREIRAGDRLVGTFVHIKPRNLADKEKIENLKTGDVIKIKGIVSDVVMRNIEIKPAIFVNEEFAESLLSQFYGPYNLDYDCWMLAVPIYKSDMIDGKIVTSDEVSGSKTYCMRVGRTKRINHNGVDRYYVLSLGDAVDENGVLNGAHVDNGMVGAFVVELQNGKPVLIASDPSITMGTSGHAPTTWGFVNLGSDNYNGWHTETGYCGMGECDISHVILAPSGKKIRNLATHLPSSYSYEDDRFGTPPSDINVKIEIDSSNPNDKVYPLRLSIAGVKEGKKLEPKILKVLFDSKQWKYVAPKE